MKRCKILIFLAIFLTVTPCRFAHALIDIPTFRMGIGQSPMSFTAGSSFPEPTAFGNIVTLNPMFLWDIPGVRSRVGIHYQGDIGSKYGFMSLNGMGITGLMYPMGLSSSREVHQDFSEVVKTRISPYVQFSVTAMKVSVLQIPAESDPLYSVPSRWPYFSATIIETAFGAGCDYPLSDDLIAFLGLHYRVGAFKDQETSSGNISYSGPEILLGVMTNFY